MVGRMKMASKCFIYVWTLKKTLNLIPQKICLIKLWLSRSNLLVEQGLDIESWKFHFVNSVILSQLYWVACMTTWQGEGSFFKQTICWLFDHLELPNKLLWTVTRLLRKDCYSQRILHIKTATLKDCYTQKRHVRSIRSESKDVEPNVKWSMICLLFERMN